ncbi:MAG TPA: LLM class flavin-dependent oxidoreductase [Actinomycetota bacterium]|nr:LLM class flavin-dependent oxidoreductase [Actinomycetota bacterium]
MTSQRLGLTIPLESLPIPETVIPLARLAESLGYTDLWSAEVSGTDGLTPLAAAAAVTESLRFGTAILPVFTRPPALMAMGAASLQAISGGRFVLGIGTSSSIIVGRWMGEEFSRPLTRIRETVAFLRDALEGKKMDVDANGFNVHGFRLTAETGAKVPIYIAGLGPKMLRLAGQIADGVILFLFTPDGVRSALEQVRAGAEDVGRDVSEIDVVARIPVAVDEDDEFLRFMLRRLTTNYAIVDVYNASLTRQGFGDPAESISKLWQSGERDKAAAAVTDEMLEGLYLFGSAEDVRNGIEGFREAGIKTPVLFPLSVAGDPAERLDRVKKTIEVLAP